MLSTILTLAGPACGQPPTPVAHWQLNGDLTALVGGADGTGVGTPTFTAGRLDQCVVLNGTTQYVDLGTGSRSLLTGAAELTVACWIRTTSTAEDRLVSSYDGGIDAGFTFEHNRGAAADAGKIRLFVRPQTGLNTAGYTTSDIATLNDGAWHHLAGTWASLTTIGLYFDGQPGAVTHQDQTAEGAMSALDQNIFVGCFNNAGTPQTFYAGDLDDVRLYDVALTDAEVLGLYNASRARYYHNASRGR